MKPQTALAIGAWAFMVTEKGVPYFVTGSDGEAEIYLKKPKNRPNPFDYSHHAALTWKPTKITITPLTK